MPDVKINNHQSDNRKERYTATNNQTNKTTEPTQPLEIFVIIEGGVVHEIVNLPDHIHVTIIDYDTEGVEKERLEISPIDGELCVINRW